LLGDRVPGRSTGELEGVIFREALGPEKRVVAIGTFEILTPLSAVFSLQTVHPKGSKGEKTENGVAGDREEDRSGEKREKLGAIKPS
jgi:hypothetical protein